VLGLPPAIWGKWELSETGMEAWTHSVLEGHQASALAVAVKNFLVDLEGCPMLSGYHLVGDQSLGMTWDSERHFSLGLGYLAKKQVQHC